MRLSRISDGNALTMDLGSTSQLTIDASHPASKQAVILHDASTLPTALISTLVSTDHVGSLLITDGAYATGNPYGAFASYWTSFVSTVAADS